MTSITDWTDAYDNGKAVGGSEPLIEAFQEKAKRFRDSIASDRQRLGETYGQSERQQFDLFLPSVTPVGLLVFVHGGYWMRLDRSIFSHLAAGPTDRGWAVAMPGYDLCPQVSIATIAQQIKQAITTVANRSEFADKPLRLVGHSAGGHLVTRVVSTLHVNKGKDDALSPDPAALPAAICQRVAHVVSISGLHDLRPLIKTALNDTLAIDSTCAQVESPALLTPLSDTALTCWVGNDELSEFKRQSALLTNVWSGLGPRTQIVAEPAKNHFTVVDNLQNKSSPIVDCILSF